MIKNKDIDLTVIILTYNEELNIDNSIKSISNWVNNIYILDSFSNDNTKNIALSHNVNFIERKFDNYSNQRNFAINHLKIQTGWILFLDADEYLTEELKNEISNELLNPKFDGYYLKRRFYFMNKWIKWGGYYPTYILRLFKKEKGLFQREVNEHLFLNGKAGYLKYDFCDNNKKSFHEWFLKHLTYAKKEATDLYLQNKLSPDISFWGSQADRKSWIRYKIWNKFPILIRPFIYFIYRYFFRLGILDGIRGFIFHFMHGLVYFLLMDIFYYEMKKNKE
jgi:glycosyltransferase involved in cell wall biosynthesis